MDSLLSLKYRVWKTKRKEMCMETNLVTVNVARTETGYTATCDRIDGWIVAVEGTFGELETSVKESIEFYVECAKSDNEEYDHVFDGDYKLVYHFDVRSLLSYYQNIFSLSALQYITGINQRQLSHYLNGTSKPRAQQAKKIQNGLRNLAKELSCVSL